MADTGMRETRLDLVTRLYALEAEIANVEEAIAETRRRDARGKAYPPLAA